MRSYVFEKREKGVFDLLKNCISADRTRESLCHAYYNGKGCIYATTGYRLVKIESKTLSEKLGDNPGFFDITGSALIESAYSNEPIDYERVIPSGVGENFILPKATQIKGKHIDALIYAAVCYYTGKVFNPESFQGARGIEWNKIFFRNGGSTVRMDGGVICGYNITFVAMAMNASFMGKSETLEKAV